MFKCMIYLFRNMKVREMNVMKDMDMVKQHYLMVIHMKECMKMVKEMAKERIGMDMLLSKLI